MKVAIFGTGYVGLVSGVCFAEMGHEVLCMDIDEQKIQNLKNGIIPIYEPGLEPLAQKAITQGRLTFTTDPKEAIAFGEVIFSAVGTPPDQNNNNKADLKYVYQVAQTFGETINSYKVFINKSTVPVGTGKECRDIIKKEIQKRGKNIDFDVVSNPEFLREGSAVYDFLHPDRIVIGLQTPKAKHLMQELYRPFQNNTKILYTDIKSAEIIKYASNAFLATKISFINEIANFAEITGGNITDISYGMGLDPRIGDKFLNSGIGYGGSCFPKDVKALIETGKEVGYNFQIIKSTENVNASQKLKVIDILQTFMSDIAGKTITLWGLAFKPNTDDIREAPSLSVIERLIDFGAARVQVYDPIALENTKTYYKDSHKDTLFFYTDAYEALDESDALIALTEWSEFEDFDKKLVKKYMKGNIIVDGRNIWSHLELEKDGFKYKGIGKNITKDLRHL